MFQGQIIGLPRREMRAAGNQCNLRHLPFRFVISERRNKTQKNRMIPIAWCITAPMVLMFKLMQCPHTCYQVHDTNGMYILYVRLTVCTTKPVIPMAGTIPGHNLMPTTDIEPHLFYLLKVV